MLVTAHAYLVKGGSERIPEILATLEKEGVATKGNPDLYARAFSFFSIDDARELRERAALRATGEKGRVFVVAAPTIAVEAQNALLKTLEEPPAGARFILIVPSPETLLPTLRSRMQELRVDSNKARPPGSVDAEKFLAATTDARLDLLKPLLEKGEDDRRDLAGTIAFLADLEAALGNAPKENVSGLKSVYRARKFITDKGAHTKSLLEQVALLTPRM